MDSEEKKFVKTYFNERIYPILSPQIVDPHHPFPHLTNKDIYIACLLKNKDKNIFGIVPVPDTLPSVVFLPGKPYRYINVENIIYQFLDKIFATYELAEKTIMSVTRNADINLDDDDTEKENKDFRKQMKKLLHLRKRLAVVRLETSNPMSKTLTRYLCEKFEIKEYQIYVMRAPIQMDFVFDVIDTVTEKENKELLYKPFSPVNHIDSSIDMMKLARKRDILLHFPYDSMKPFLNLIKQAAMDPDVVSIKITIYRVAMNATLIDYLCAAAENGKDVTTLIELRARFDEQNNIDWSEKLEDAGCTVIYGFEDYKCHSKVCLITYRDKGTIKYITQVGTGNYNEKTAGGYTDLSFITSNQEIGQDATEFFKNMSIGSLKGNYKHLLVAPIYLKSRLSELIDEEIEKGEEGRIFFKCNSLTEIDIINKLAEASQAGVKTTMILRGICCILPGIPGITKNIEVRGIVGRFLEHHRIYSFGTGADQKIFISSADLMTRNLDRRVEVACPIYDSNIKEEINDIIKTALYDNVKARRLDSNGNYHRIKDNKIKINSQDLFIEKSLQKQVILPDKDDKKSLFQRIMGFLKGN